jgi:hypothetical protein
MGSKIVEEFTDDQVSQTQIKIEQNEKSLDTMKQDLQRLEMEVA